MSAPPIALRAIRFDTSRDSSRPLTSQMPSATSTMPMTTVT